LRDARKPLDELIMSSRSAKTEVPECTRQDATTNASIATMRTTRRNLNPLHELHYAAAILMPTLAGDLNVLWK
jgi:hypothetical protein